MSTQSNAAIITGGSRGIGRAIAIKLAHKGYDVALIYEKSEGEAKEVANIINSLQRKCLLIKANLCFQDDLKKITDTSFQTYNRVDLLVNSAGVYLKNSFGETTEEVWCKTLNINLKSVYFLTQLIVPYMKRQKQGNIINIASISGSMVVDNSIDYGISKAGVIYLTRCLAKILAPEIRVNCVSPGPTITDMTGYGRNLEKRSYVEKKIPLGKVNTPEQIAEAVAFLASNKAENITGQVIEVDGGLSLQS